MKPGSAGQDASPAGFDRLRRTAGLFLGPALLIAVLAAPLDLEPRAHRLAAVFALVIVYWITEAIPLPVTALLGPALAVVLRVAPAREAFASFGHPILFLFLGSFIIARAMSENGLDRRIALFVLSRSWVGEHRGRILFAFGAIAALLSMWMSNTATTAMMLPIGLGVLKTLPRGDDDGATGASGRYDTALLLMIAFSCEIGGLATPVGTPPNLIAIGMLENLLGREISFVAWMRFAVPLALVCFALLYVVVMRVFRIRGESTIAGAAEAIRHERATVGRWSRGERAALSSFLVAVVLWTAPGIVSLALGNDSPVAKGLAQALPEGPAAILAASLLFLVPVDWSARRFVLDWRRAVRVDWGTILLFGGGLSLGSLAFSTGLAAAAGGGLLARSGRLSPALLVLIGVFTAMVITEFMSNTATASLLVPLFLALPGLSASSTALPALAATLGCSLAFCLPVATPPNAIVYGSGLVPLTRMIRLGILLDLGCGLLTWALFLLLPGWVTP